MNKQAANYYDYAILGGGGAGLSAICHLHWAGALHNKRLLLVEPEIKQQHDRTWSFWESGQGPFESIVKHRWSSVGIHNTQHQNRYEIEPLAYKMIYSTDFYAYCNALIATLPQVERVQARAQAIQHIPEGVQFCANNTTYRCRWALSSLPHPLRAAEVTEPYLDQHFRGWFIRTLTPAFDPHHATMMDFRTPQSNETRFLYVLPTSTTEALVEVAIFSNQHLPSTAYDQIITNYLHDHWKITTLPNKKPNFHTIQEIYHTEQGVIPMTTYPYPYQDQHLLHIGLAGGQARPSTGYTFYNMQRQLAQLAKQLTTNVPKIKVAAPWPSRHLVYDATILSILQQQELVGEALFPLLFAKNPTPRVLRFLNAETSLLEELQLMATTPVLHFGRAFLRAL